MKRALVILGIAAAIAAVPARAWASSITFGLGDGNPDIAGYPSPYATVTIDLTSPNTATITFQSLPGYLMGGQGAAGVNVNATTWTLGGITGVNTNAGFTAGPLSGAGAGNEDGFGSFNQTLDSFDGFTHSSTQISFTLTNTSGIWATPNAVLVLNGSGGDYAAAHIFVCATTPCEPDQNTNVTGYAASSSLTSTTQQLPPSVPEPATLTLLGSGLFFAATRMRRLKA